MNNTYQHYIIDLSSNNNFVQIPTVQGDGNNIRGFEVELIENGVQYEIDKNDCLVAIMGTKPDTSQIMNDCTVSDKGYILVDITSQMSAVKGRGDYQIVLMSRSTNSQLKSFPFHILTTPAAFDIDYIVSSDEFQTLTRNIFKTEEVINDANQTISDVRTLETSVKNAEAGRVDAENKRVSAENTRTLNENTRISNENTRKSSETNRQNAETSRVNAENVRVTAENTRVVNENARISDENTRKNNENSRQTAEVNRQNAETERINTETERVNAENTRISNENTRKSAENARVSEESKRDSAENIRKTNEITRQTQEADREEKTSAAIQNAQQATQAAIDATTDLQDKLDNHHFVLTEDKDMANGVPSLDADRKVPLDELRDATTESKGIVRLTDSVTSSSTTTAATPNSVKAVYDALNTEKNRLHNVENKSSATIRSEITKSNVTDALGYTPYTPNEVDNKLSTLETNIDWKESVNTFNDIATTYPNPQDGWTVNVKDTDYTYRYNGSEWVAISANAIPKATNNIDGLLSKEDHTNYDDANSKKHTHNNKAALDNITEDTINKINNITAHTHDDRYYTESEVDTLLAGKAASNHTHTYASSGHTHDERYYTETEVNNLLNGKANSSHTHDYLPLTGGTLTGPVIATAYGPNDNVHNNMQVRAYTGNPSSKAGRIYFQEAFTDDGNYVNVGIDGLGATGVNHAKVADVVAWSGVSGKPSSYPPSSHTHDDRYYTENEINTKLSSKADTGHTHNYLSLSGGTMNGTLKIPRTAQLQLENWGFHAENDQMLKIIPKEGDFTMTLGVVDVMWTLSPWKDGTYQLGSPNHKFGNVYANHGTIITSDRNKKTDINDISNKYLDFFSLLQPVTYRFKDSSSGRIHIGFISQDVETAMAEVGLSDLDFAGFCKDKKRKEIVIKHKQPVVDDKGNELLDENGNLLTDEYDEVVWEDELDENNNPLYVYSLRYEEFIALNTAVIQKQQRQIEDLEKRLEKLEKIAYC